MPDFEPFHHHDTQHLVSGHPEQVGATKITTVGTNPIMETAHGDRGEQRGQAQQHSQPRQHSMMTIVLIAAVVSLISGAIGAMGYTHYLAPKPGEASSSQTQTKGGPNRESSSARSGGMSSANSAAQPNTTEMNAEAEAGELKQQITNLNKRIERLGERVDRLQELLSLAVPLLQRIAPKH